MIDGYLVRREDSAYAASWYVSNLMNIHLKHSIEANELAKPFIRLKSKEQREREKDEFLREFQRQRKEALAHGDSSEYLD